MAGTTTRMRHWILFGVAYLLVTYSICAGIAFSMCDGEPWVFGWQLAVYILVLFQLIQCLLPHYLSFSLPHIADDTNARPLVHHYNLRPRRMDTHPPPLRAPANLQPCQDLCPNHGDMVRCELFRGLGAAVRRRAGLVVVWLRLCELGATEVGVVMVLM